MVLGGQKIVFYLPNKFVSFVEKVKSPSIVAQWSKRGMHKVSILTTLICFENTFLGDGATGRICLLNCTTTQSTVVDLSTRRAFLNIDQSL